jgi:hypothetical protein
MEDENAVCVCSNSTVQHMQHLYRLLPIVMKYEMESVLSTIAEV